MKNIWYAFAFIIGVTMISACSSTTGDVDDNILEKDFAPMFVGKYLEYSVDSTIYDNQGNTLVQSSSFIREEFKEVVLDSQNDSAYIVQEYWRASNQDVWTFRKAWTSKIYVRSLEINTDNLRFVKLIFPPKVGSTWEGNQYIDPSIKIIVRGEVLEMYKFWEEYRITDRNAETFGIIDLEDVITIEQVDAETLIEKRFSQEKYAKGVGLVSRTMEILDIDCSNCPDMSTPWEEKATKGFTLTQTIIDYN